MSQPDWHLDPSAIPTCTIQRWRQLYPFASAHHADTGRKQSAQVVVFDLTNKDTEANVRGRIKSMLWTYRKQRDEGRYNSSLLRKMIWQIALYRLIVPTFCDMPVRSFDDLLALVDELPEGRKTPWQDGYEYLCLQLNRA